MNFPGNFKGIVIDQIDDAERSRVKVWIPSLGTGEGEDIQEFVAWYPVKMPSSSHVVPDEGETVTVQFGEFAEDPTDGFVEGTVVRLDDLDQPVIPEPAKGREDFVRDLGTEQMLIEDPETGEEIIFTDLQSQQQTGDPSNHRITTREQSGLREEFDPGASRVKWRTNSGNQMEIGNSGASTKVSTMVDTVLGQKEAFVHGSEVTNIGRTRFLRSKKEKIESSFRRQTFGRKVETSGSVDKEIQISETKKIKGIKETRVGLKYRRSVGGTFETTAYNEERFVGGKKSEVVGGTVLGVPASAPGVSLSKLTQALTGDIREGVLTGNRDFTLTLPKTRVRIGTGDSTTGIYIGTASIMSSPLQTPAENTVACVKGQFLIELQTILATGVIPLATEVGATIAALETSTQVDQAAFTAIGTALGIPYPVVAAPFETLAANAITKGAFWTALLSTTQELLGLLVSLNTRIETDIFELYSAGVSTLLTNKLSSE